MKYPIYLTPRLEYYEMPEGDWTVTGLTVDFAQAKNADGVIYKIARGADGALHAEEISQLQLVVEKSRLSKDPADSVHL